MSVLIKGGVMPLTCEECPCYDNNDYSCNVTGRGVIEYRFDGRPDGCPLVEVPTPHGKLIDADAVEKRLQKYWYEEYPNQEASYHRAFMDSNACVKDLPTIIEAEVSAE